MENESPIWTDPERLGGKPCFRGTRVPIDALFDNLEAGLSLDQFLDEFQGVTRGQAISVLERARHSLVTALPAAA